MEFYSCNELEASVNDKLYWYLIDDLMLTVQTISAGIASISKKIINNSYLEFRINIPTNQPIITVLYNLCLKEKEPLFHLSNPERYKTSSKTSSKTCNSEILEENSSLSKTAKIDQMEEKDLNITSPVIVDEDKYSDENFRYKKLRKNNSNKGKEIILPEISLVNADVNSGSANNQSDDLIMTSQQDDKNQTPLTREKEYPEIFIENDETRRNDSVDLNEAIEQSSKPKNLNLSNVSVTEKQMHKSLSNIVSKLKLQKKNTRKNIKISNPDEEISHILKKTAKVSSQFVDSVIKKKTMHQEKEAKWDKQKVIEEENNEEKPVYIISDNINDITYYQDEPTCNIKPVNFLHADEINEIQKFESSQFINQTISSLDDDQDIDFIPVECLLTTCEVKNLSDLASTSASSLSSTVRKRNRKAIPKKQIEKKYECKYCDKLFNELHDKDEHEKMHTGDKPYICKYCNERFTRREKKLAHERTHNNKELVPARIDKAFECTYCGKSFAQKTNKTEHERTHTGERPYSCKFCKKTFTQFSNKSQHERIHTGKQPYNCNYCEKTFITSRYKKQHERIHSGEKPYSCNFCGKTFAHRKILIHHERIHTGEKPYSCSYCEKTFIQPNQKTEHEKIHTGVKPFACSFCGKAFTQKHDKIQHERIHTGERPYSCMYCGKSFSYKPKLIQHERIHTGERPYSCSYCEKTFNVRNHKTIHERIHTGVKPYACSFCGKAFAKNSNKKQHEKIHTGEKPHSCNYCEKTFILRSQKIIHERTHTGEKPYACSYCDKTFILKNQKTKHESTHIKQEIVI